MQEHLPNETGIVGAITAPLPRGRAPRKSRGSAAVHKALIQDLAEYPEVRTKGFWEALRALPDAEYFSELVNDDKEWVAANKFIPDAYAIHADERSVVLFEVVVTHDIPAYKMRKIMQLMWALDQDEWQLGLVRIDMTGRKAYDPMAMAIIEICRGVDQGVEGTVKAGTYPGWQLGTADVTGRILTRLNAEGADRG